MMGVIDKLEVLEHQADEFGFSWETPQQIIEQIQSECQEVLERLGKNERRDDLQEEIGDLMHAVFSLCVFCQFSSEETLTHSVDKFERRLKTVMSLAKSSGLTTLKGHSFDELMQYWQRAKRIVG